MGQRNKAAVVLARAREPLDVLDSPRVTQLTERFLELRRQIFRDLVDIVIELGEVMLAARPLLRGVYGRWLKERLGVDRATAENYVALARLAKEAPGVIQRWKELGTTKLYRVARLEPDGRRAVLRAPGITDMSDVEFAEIAARYRVTHRRVTGNMRAHGLRMKIQGFAVRLSRVRVPTIDDSALRSGLRRDLLDLARRIRELAQQVK